jgi:predicted  nucleic acid-binding Zn-ribbon protein
MKNPPKRSAPSTVRALQHELERARYREEALEAALIRRRKELAAAEEKIRRIQRTLSWRVTKPLRLASRVLRRLAPFTKSTKRSR